MSVARGTEDKRVRSRRPDVTTKVAERIKLVPRRATT